MTDASTASGPLHLALFDLDHTLLDGDSNTLWLDYLIDRGHLPAGTREAQAAYMERYVAGELDIRDYLGFHLRLLAGRTLPEWLPIRADFVATAILPCISAAARAAVARHRAAGHRAVVVTATHEFLSAPIAGLFDLPVIAPRGEVVAERFSGEIAGVICFREHKLTCLERWLGEQGLSAHCLGERHFYSDSANDLPLLEAVSHPVIVNADPALQRIARERGWPLATWRAP